MTMLDEKGLEAQAINRSSQLRFIANNILKEDLLNAEALRRVADLLDRLSTAGAETVGWRDIESAPRDGTEVLLAAGSRVTVGHWTTEEECRVQIGDCGGVCRCPEYEYQDPTWLSWDGGFTTEHPPTHWMPLPPPPATNTADSGSAPKDDGATS
mgnify:CR=1 FL=1